MYGVPVH